MEVIVCKNCGARVENKYCSHCGQDRNTRRIEKGFLFKDLNTGLFNIDTGLLFTIRELWTRPGHAIKDFIEGKRVKYFTPLSFLILLATLYSIANHYLGMNVFHESQQDLSGSNIIYSMIDDNYVYFQLLFTPLTAIGSYWVFRSFRYNFFEHIVVATYSVSQRLLFELAILPLWLYFKAEYHSTFLSRVSLAVDFGLILWCYFQFFYKKSAVNTILKVLLMWLINIILLFLMSSLIYIVYEVL